MTNDENDDNIINDEDDESDADDDQDDEVDTGWTDTDDTEENSMDETTTEKPVTKPAATTTPKPAARRVARGLLGAQSVAKAASAKQTIQAAAAPPPVVQPAPKPNLAKDGIAFTEEAFNAFLAAQGVDAASHPFAQLKVWGGVITKKAKDALETGTSPMDAWTSAVKSLAAMIPQMLTAQKLDETTASKIQAVIRYYIETLKAIDAAEADAKAQAAKAKADAEAKAEVAKAAAEAAKARAEAEKSRQASAKKTELGVAPPVVVPEKGKEVKSSKIPCPKCGRENSASYDHCLACGESLTRRQPAEPLSAPVALQPEVIKPPVTDPNAATELNTPAPGSSPTPSSVVSERPTITPEQRALVAAAAANIPDEQSVSFRPLAQSPKPPEAPVALAPPPVWCVDPPQPEDPAAPLAPHYGYIPPPVAAPDPLPAPAGPAAPVPQPTNPTITTTPAKSGTSALKIQVLILFLLCTGLTVYLAFFAKPATTAPSAATANPPVTAAPSETCAKVTDALVQQYYGQAKASEFSLAERPGVRLICAGKMVYKNPATGLYDIRPCQICYK